MKILGTILTLLIFGLSAGFLQAKSGLTTAPESDTLKVVNLIDTLPGVFDQKIHIKNNSIKATWAKVKVVDFDTAAGHNFTVCWAGGCFPFESLGEFAGPDTLEANEETDGLKISIRPKQSYGTSWIIVRLYNLTDSIDVKVIFNVAQSTSRKNITNNNVGIESLFPSPATDYIDLKLNTQYLNKPEIRIIDLMGKEVYKDDISIGQTNITIPVRNFSAGIYFCRLENNGVAVATKKFTIK